MIFTNWDAMSRQHFAIAKAHTAPSALNINIAGRVVTISEIFDERASGEVSQKVSLEAPIAVKVPFVADEGDGFNA